MKHEMFDEDVKQVYTVIGYIVLAVLTGIGLCIYHAVWSQVWELTIYALTVVLILLVVVVGVCLIGLIANCVGYYVCKLFECKDE